MISSINKLQKLLIFMAFGVASVCAHITSETAIQEKNSYMHYLSGLASKLSAPWAAIKIGARMQGLSREEIDAIPASYPFLYKGGYKQLGHLVGSAEFVAEVNDLLERFKSEAVGIAGKEAQRKVLHALFHRHNLSKLCLPSSTTTKQLAHMVERKSVNIDVLCKTQMAEFFVKYHLGL